MRTLFFFLAGCLGPLGAIACGPDLDDCRTLKVCASPSTGGSAQGGEGGTASVGGAGGAGGSTSGPGGSGGGGAAPFGFLSIDAGVASSCGVMTDGTVRCWGDDTYGQLGQGSTGTSTALAPIEVPGLTGVEQVSVGFKVCARKADGTMQCWGYGPVGDGNSTSTGTPTQVNLVGGIDDVAAGPRIPVSTNTHNHACAVHDGGTVSCWGDNLNGCVGLPATTSQSSTPVVVAGLTDAVQVAAGANQSCAVRAGGEVMCWGSAGHLGGASAMDSHVPVTIPGVSGAEMVAAGIFQTCALTSIGRVSCWTNSAPAVVTQLSDVVAISSGGAHMCALDGPGNVYCWGSNINGQLGTGDTMDSTTPVQVPIEGVRSISAGYGHTCAVKHDNSAYCWGAGGLIGDNTSSPRLEPTAVVID